MPPSAFESLATVGASLDHIGKVLAAILVVMVVDMLVRWFR